MRICGIIPSRFGSSRFPGKPLAPLAGKPLVTSYTVLIDTQIGENSKIDWDKVEDIKLKVTYSYNDLFEATSECVKL